MPLNRKSQSAQWIVPYEHLAITRNRNQTHLFLKTMNALLDQPENLVYGLSMEVLISLGLTDKLVVLFVQVLII